MYNVLSRFICHTDLKRYLFNNF